MLEKIAGYRKELQQCFDELDPGKLEKIVHLLLKRGRTIFVLGNGGSAATASHMAVDLGKGTRIRGGHKLRVISLTDSSMLTAWSNDEGYEVAFKEQLENLLMPRDLVIGISASGNSPNILAAMRYAKESGAVTVGLIGFGGGKLKDIVDLDVTVSSQNYGVVEDFHLILNHIISQFIKEFYERGERWNRPSY